MRAQSRSACKEGVLVDARQEGALFDRREPRGSVEDPNGQDVTRDRRECDEPVGRPRTLPARVLWGARTEVCPRETPVEPEGPRPGRGDGTNGQYDAPSTEPQGTDDHKLLDSSPCSPATKEYVVLRPPGRLSTVVGVVGVQGWRHPPPSPCLPCGSTPNTVYLGQGQWDQVVPVHGRERPWDRRPVGWEDPLD